MRDSLILPIIYLFVFLILSLFLTGLYIVLELAATMETSGFSINKLPLIIRDVIPVSSIVSLLFIFIRILKKPGIHILTFMLPLATAFCVLFFGIIGINMIVKPVEETVPVKNYIKPGKFLFFDNNILYIGSISDNTVSNIIYIDSNDLFLNPGNNMKIYKYIDRAQAELKDNKINIHSADITLSLDTMTYYSGFYAADSILESVFNGISLLNRELNEFLQNNLLEFAILCFSFVFIVMASNVFMRITRWPLFNFFVVMFITIGSVFLYNFLKNHIVMEFFSEISDSFFLRMIPSISLLLIGLIFVFIDIIFIPFDFWSREIENA